MRRHCEHCQEEIPVGASEDVRYHTDCLQAQVVALKAIVASLEARLRTVEGAIEMLPYWEKP